MKNPKYARKKCPICIPALLESRIQMGLWFVAERV